MFNNAQAYATLPAADLERAKKFYSEKLGLRLIREDPSPGALFQAGGGTVVYLYQRAATKADHTVAAFEISDFDATFNELKGRGIKFEDYNLPNLKTKNGVFMMQSPAGVMKGAWFKDTEGNILGLTNML
jgi:catechol 2,3-dioxygenase-like lactoylglutathione lyase family enzyme